MFLFLGYFSLRDKDKALCTVPLLLIIPVKNTCLIINRCGVCFGGMFSKGFTKWEIHLCHMLRSVWLCWWSKIPTYIFHRIPCIGIVTGKKYLKQDSLSTSDGHGQELETHATQDRGYKHNAKTGVEYGYMTKMRRGQGGSLNLTKATKFLMCIPHVPTPGIHRIFFIWVEFKWMVMVHLKSFPVAEQNYISHQVFKIMFHCSKKNRIGEWLDLQWQVSDGKGLFDLTFYKMQW